MDGVDGPKKTMCAYTGCRKRAAVVVGSCNYCNHVFCLKHRIPEAHECVCMAHCKKRAVDLNTTNLTNGKCVGLKL